MHRILLSLIFLAGCTTTPTNDILRPKNQVSLSIDPRSGSSDDALPQTLNVVLTGNSSLTRPISDVVDSAIMVRKGTSESWPLTLQNDSYDEVYRGFESGKFELPQVGNGDYEFQLKFQTWKPSPPAEGQVVIVGENATVFPESGLWKTNLYIDDRAFFYAGAALCAGRFSIQFTEQGRDVPTDSASSLVSIEKDGQLFECQLDEQMLSENGKVVVAPLAWSLSCKDDLKPPFKVLFSDKIIAYDGNERFLATLDKRDVPLTALELQTADSTDASGCQLWKP